MVAVASAQYAAHGILPTRSSITEWASGYSNLVRGPVDIKNPTGPAASYGAGPNAVGAADGSVVSLGDGGQITLSFDKPITNGDGADFAVFENGFYVSGTSLVFAELGYVEVSSDGQNFVRFPSVSLTQTQTQTGAFAGTDPTKVHNLAGQFGGGEGAPFDLSDVGGLSSLVDVNHITAVRVIDVVGTIDPAYACYDSRGNIINDPYSTPFASGGFDLDGVGVINAVPEPGSLLVLGLGTALVLRRRKR